MHLLRPNISKLIGRRDVDGLVRALGERDAVVRAQAAYALGDLGGPGTAEALAARLDDDDALVRLTAATSLGRIGDARAVEPLVTWATEPGAATPASRVEVVEVLGGMKHAQAAPALVSLLADQVPGVRQAAVDALAALRGRIVVDALTAALGDATRCEPAALALLCQPRKVRQRVVRTLCGQAGGPALTPLVARQLLRDADVVTALLDDDDAHVRAGAAAVLTQLGEEASGQEHIAEMVPRLEKRGDVDALATLAARLHQPPWDRERGVRLRDTTSGPALRVAVVEALGRLGDPRGLDVVAQQLYGADATDPVARAARQALPRVWDGDRLGPLGEAALDDALRRPAAPATATVLGGIGDARAAGLLLKAARAPDTDRSSTVAALADVSDRDALVRGLLDPKPEARTVTRRAVEKIGVAATESLLGVLDDAVQAGREQLEAVVTCLGHVGDKRVIEPLAGLLRGGRLGPPVSPVIAVALLSKGSPGVQALLDAIIPAGRAGDAVDVPVLGLLLGEHLKSLTTPQAVEVSRALLAAAEGPPGALPSDEPSRYGIRSSQFGTAWARIGPLLPHRLKHDLRLVDGEPLHRIVDQLLANLEHCAALGRPLWLSSPAGWCPLDDLVHQRIEVFDNAQLQRVVALTPIEVEVWGGDERETGGAFTTYDPELWRQLATAELRRRAAQRS